MTKKEILEVIEQLKSNMAIRHVFEKGIVNVFEKTYEHVNDDDYDSKSKNEPLKTLDLALRHLVEYTNMCDTACKMEDAFVKETLKKLEMARVKPILETPITSRKDKDKDK